MALAGTAVMINWSDVPIEFRSQFYAFHSDELQIKRMSIPGFNCGRRYISIRARRDILNMYEVDNLAVLTGPEYTYQTSNPSKSTQEASKWLKNAIRGFAKVRLSLGNATGGIAMTLRIDVAPGREQELEQHLVGHTLPAISGDPEIASVHLLVTDQDSSSVITSERRSQPTEVPRWIVMIEGISVDALDRIYEKELTQTRLAQAGAQGPVFQDVYQLQSMVQKGWPK